MKLRISYLFRVLGLATFSGVVIKNYKNCSKALEDEKQRNEKNPIKKY